MADTDIEPLANGTGPMSEEEAERMKQRPADIDADVREMERRKRVEALMSSKLFREELERVLDQQLHEGGDAPLLQRIKEMVGGRLHSGSFRGPSCVLPINDIRGIEGVGYEKGEKILRCKLAAAYRLVDLFGWTQTGLTGQITARLNTAIEQVLTTPRGVLPHEVTASSLVKVDMQGTVVDQGTTNFPVNVEGFSVHGMVHAARPDLRCVLHVRAPAALAVSAMKKGLLPLCTEAALLGEIAYHHMPYGSLDNEEQEKLVRALGPHAKILILTSAGALCCGATLEEAFFNARNLTAACDVQLRLSSIPLDDLTLIDEEAKRQIYEQSRKAVASEKNWRVGGEEFEALMRMLDNAGFRTGYVYRHPLIKNDVPRPKNDVEVPPAVSSLGYLLEEEELYRQGLWKKGHGKAGERTRWLNSPNVYQKVEVLETGTNDPKKITKWVDANNEEWVQDSSPQHSSTPVKIDTLQFVPKNTNPKEFKKLQQLIKDNRRADKITSGPQSHILEGVTWDEAAKLVGEDAANTNTGDHVVLMGAASKGIIQRGYQHNATMYSAPYARNPFDHVSDSEIADYRRIVERKQRSDYDTDVSESEPLSGAVLTSPLTETDGESHDEHRVLRIETKKVPVRSQPEIVLSDDFLNSERAHADRTKGTLIQEGTLTQDPNSTLTEALNSNQRSIHEYSRTTNFENVIKKFNSPDSASKHSKYQNPRDPNETAVDIVAASINSVSIGVANSELDDVTLFEARVANSVVNTVKVDFDPVVHFARVRERFNSPENFEVKKMTCHSCSLEKIESPVYEHVKKFTMMSASNVQKGVDVHPKCKVSLTARLSGEKPVSNAKLDKNDKKTDGHYLRRDENENQKLANAPKITDQDKSDTQKFILKNSSSLSGLAKLACEIKNDAINLNSKIAIETLNSKLASESSSDGYDSLKSNKEKELYSYALDLYNPGNNSPRSSLYSIPSIDWDGRCKSDYTFRTRSLPRQRSNKQHRLYRTQSHSGFINAHLKDPEPNHFHLPRCNSCGATNVSYTWELIKEDLNSIKSGRKTFKVPTSLYRSVDDIHQNYFDEATKVKVTKKVFPVYKVTNLDVEFEESQEFTEDNYIGDIGNSFSSDNQTVIEKVVLVDQNTTITEETLNYDASTDKKEVDEKYECDKLDGNRDENESKDQDIKVKYDYQSKADISQFETAQRCTDAGYITGATKEKDLHRAELVQIVNEEEKNIETDNTISTEGEYHSFTDEMDFDTSYVSPVKELVEKDIRDYSVPMDMYFEDYKKRISPSKSPKSPNRREVIPASPRGVLEPILEESKSSYGDDSGNMSNVDGQKSSVDTSTEKSKDDSKTEIGTDSSIESKGIRKEEIIYKHLEPDTPIIDEESNTEFELDIPTPKTEKASNEDLGDQNISVEISLKPQYDKLHEIIEKTVTTIYQSSENEDSDDDIITEKKKIVSTVTIDDKTSSVTDVQSMVQDIITTAVTASKLKTEISLSSCHKITREILQTEYLQRDSYFLAEEEDTTTNDIESVSTNAVQTAIDVYTEEHDVEVTDPDQIDMLDCVYNNVFEILSEEAISAQIEMKLDDGDIENKIIANHKKKKNESSLDGLKEKLCERVIPDNIDTQHFGATKKSFTEESATEKYDSNKIKTLTLEVDTPCEKSSEDGLAIVDDMKSEEVLADVIIKDRISAFEYSTISSSVGGLRSFDSTVEFEMYEVVSDVMWTIINKIDFQVQQNSCEIFNGLPKEQKVSFDFETKIIDAANITVPATCLTYEEQENFESLENIEFNPEAESLNNSDQKIEPPSFQVESEDVLKEITTFDFGGKTESTHSVIIEMPLDIQDVKAGISETDTQEPEISEDFSIAKIIQDMELNLNLNETVLTESSEMDLSPAQRIAEALIYYIFDRTFCLITKKMKLQKSKQIKKVITVVETEDILLTAMSLWTVESLECTKSISDDVDIPSSETSLVAEQLFETQALSPHKLTVDDTSTMSPENDDQNSINDKHSLKILMDEVLDEVETCLNNDSEPIATSSEFHEIDTTPVTVVECKVSTKFEMKTHSIISLNVDPTYDNNLHENEAAPSNDEHESNLSEKQFEVSTELNSDNQLNFDDIQKNIAAELNPSEETDDNVSMNNFEIFYKDHHFNSPAESETDFSVNADIEIHDKNYVDREIFDSEESDNEDMNAKVLAIHMYDRNANKDYFAFGHSSKYDMDVEVSNADFDADFQPIIYEENVTGCPTTPHNNTKPEEGFETEIDIHHVCERGETIASDHSFKLDLPLDISGICDAESQCCDENEYPTSFYFPRNTSTEVNSEKNSQEDSHITLDLHSSELNDTTNLDFESGLSGIEINNNSGSRTSIDPNETFLNTTYNIEDKLNQIVCEDDSTEENRSSFEVAKEIVSDIMDKSLLDHCKPTCKHCKELVIHSSNESECSNRTFILEGSSSDMNTAFVVDSPEPDEFYSRSSSPHKEISVFVKCGESPIRNVSNSFVSEASALVDDDTLYEKHDAILGSPFLKQAPVISMSQTVNAGGVKYWISFDNSLTENVKKNYGYRRVRKFDDGNLKVPSFITMNFKDLKNEEGTSSCAEEKTWPVHDKEFKPTSVLLDGIDFNKSNETKTEESYTTYVSTDYHTCESDFNNSKTEKKLLYDTRIDLHTKAVRRQYNSWPPFEDTVFYKIISKFRMSESFDSKDMEHAKIDNSI